MKEHPFFSVVLTTHNAQETIGETLRSVLNQSFDDFEIIVVDDNSVDGTVNMIEKELKLTNIGSKVVCLTDNMGVSVARNKGINSSSGYYIAFLDDDDLWCSDKLIIQHNIIIENDVDWVFSNYYVINEEYVQVGKRYREPGYYAFNKFVIDGNPVGLLTVVIKKQILLKYEFKDVQHEDYDLWLEISQHGYCGYLIKDYLAMYMKRSSSASSNKMKSAYWTYLVFRRHNIGNIKSVFLIVRYFINVLSRKR